MLENHNPIVQALRSLVLSPDKINIVVMCVDPVKAVRNTQIFINLFAGGGEFTIYHGQSTVEYTKTGSMLLFMRNAEKARGLEYNDIHIDEAVKLDADLAELLKNRVKLFNKRSKEDG